MRAWYQPILDGELFGGFAGVGAQGVPFCRAIMLGACLSVWAWASPSVHDLEAQYRFACARCHGLDGNALSPAGARLPGRVLADRRWLASRKDEDLLASILKGKGAMPSFRYKLTEEEAERLLREIVRPFARRRRPPSSAW